MPEDVLTPPNFTPSTPAKRTRAPRAPRDPSTPAANQRGGRPRKTKTPTLETPPAAPSVVVSTVEPPPIPSMPSNEEVQRTLDMIHQAEERIRVARTQADGLTATIAETFHQLDRLRKHAEEVRELDDLRRSLAEVEGRIGAFRQQAADLSRDIEGATGIFKEANEHIASAREHAEAVRRRADEAASISQTAEQQAHAASTKAEQTRQEIDSLRESLQATKSEFHSLDQEAAQVLKQLREAVENARSAVPAPQEPAVIQFHPEQELVEPVSEPASTSNRETRSVPDHPEMPPIDTVPAEERAEQAQGRMLQLLNEAIAIEKEQAGLLQSTADDTEGADLRWAFEEHRARGEEQQKSLEERLIALGGKPAGGRGVLDKIVTNIWTALQEPTESGGSIESLLKALSMIELKASLYLALHALARALGDQETSELAAGFLEHERAFEIRLRGQIAPSAVRLSRRAELLSVSS